MTVRELDTSESGLAGRASMTFHVADECVDSCIWFRRGVFVRGRGDLQVHNVWKQLTGWDGHAISVMLGSTSIV